MGRILDNFSKIFSEILEMREVTLKFRKILAIQSVQIAGMIFQTRSGCAYMRCSRYCAEEISELACEVRMCAYTV